jgi:hypothetical protein
LWVKTGKAQTEQIFSGLPPTADISPAALAFGLRRLDRTRSVWARLVCRLGIRCRWPVDRKDDGASFRIVVDGRSDTLETALEAGIFLKERQPQSEVPVRDVRSDVRIVIGWKNGSAFSSDVVPVGRA